MESVLYSTMGLVNAIRSLAFEGTFEISVQPLVVKSNEYLVWLHACLLGQESSQMQGSNVEQGHSNAAQIAHKTQSKTQSNTKVQFKSNVDF